MNKIKLFCLLAVFILPIAVLADDKAAPSAAPKDTTSKAESAAAPAASVSFKSFKEAYTAGNQALKERNFEAAVSAYGEAENLSTTPKGKSQAANAQGWALLKAKKWEEAKKALGRAVEEDADNKVAMKNLGVASFRRYEYGFAGVDELKEAVKNLEASGENQELLERAKGALTREDAYAQATATPVVEVSTDGLNFKALTALGDKLQTEGKFDQALKVFKVAETIAKSPASKAAASNRQGKVLLDARRPHESVPYFEKAVENLPKEKIYLNNMAFSYWVLYDSGKGKVDDLKKAVDAFYKANAIDASFHSDNLKMALDELKEVDPEGAKAYGVKEDKEDAVGEDEKGEAKTDKDSSEKEDSK